MENVTLLTPSDQPIKLDQVENVQLPLMFKIVDPPQGPAKPSDSKHVLGH
jgi:hypothetical protein